MKRFQNNNDKWCQNLSDVMSIMQTKLGEYADHEGHIYSR